MYSDLKNSFVQKDCASKFVVSSFFLVPALLLTTNNLSVAVVIGLLIFSSFMLFTGSKVPLNRYDYVIAACFCAYFVGAIPVAILDGSTMRYFQGGVRLLLCLPIYLFLRSYLAQHSFSSIKALTLGVIVGCFGSLAIAIYQYSFVGMDRVDGYLFSINFGYLACALTFLAVCLAQNGQFRAWLYVAALASSIATVLTFTRGAIFAIPLLLVFIAILNYKKLNFIRVFCITLFTIIVAISAYSISEGVQKRVDFTIKEFTNIAHGKIGEARSSGGRLQLWKAASYAFVSSPLTGLPYTEREVLNRELYAKGEVTKWVLTIGRGHAHSQYFEMLASNGIWGITSLFAVFFIPLSIFTHHYLKTASPIAFTAAVFVAGFMIYGLTEAPLQANLIGTFYGFMLALFFALVRIEKYPQTPFKGQ